MRMSNTYAVQVPSFLADVDYPATKQDLIEHARARHVDKGTLSQLQRIPERRYESPIAVSRACAGHS